MHDLLLLSAAHAAHCLEQLRAGCAVQVEISLQPWRAFQPDGVILFSDILTPLTGMNIPFDITTGKGPIIHDPIRTMEVSRAGGLLPSRVHPYAVCTNLLWCWTLLPLLWFAYVVRYCCTDHDQLMTWVFHGSSRVAESVTPLFTCSKWTRSRRSTLRRQRPMLGRH